MSNSAESGSSFRGETSPLFVGENDTIFRAAEKVSSPLPRQDSLCPPLWCTNIIHQFSSLPGPRRFWWTVLVGAVVLWGFADIRLRGLPWPDRPLEHKTDFTVYTAAGRAFFTGENPYEVSNPRGWKYLYPPLFALLVAPLSLLAMPEQCLVWYFISVLFCWGCYREAGRLLRGVQTKIANLGSNISPQWGSFLGSLAFLAALFPTLNCLQRGQVGILKLYLLLLGVRLVWQSAGWVGRSFGGVILAGAIVLKLTPALAVGMVLWSQLASVFSQWRQRWKVGRLAGGPGVAPKKITHSPHFVYIHTRNFDIHTQKGPLLQSNPISSDCLSEGLPQGPSQPVPLRAKSAFRCFAATALGVAVGLGLFFFLLPGAILGWQKNLEHLTYWASRVLPLAGEGFPVEKSVPSGSHQPSEQPLLPANYRTVRNQSLANGMFRLAALVDHLVFGGPEDRSLDYQASAPTRIDTPVFQAVQKAVRALLGVLLLLAGARLGASGSRSDQAAAFGLGCVGMLVISPVSWGHYFMLLVPGVLFVPLWLVEQGRSRAAFWLAVVPALLSAIHYAFLNIVGRMGLLGLGTGGWLLAACILVLRISLCSTAPAAAPDCDVRKATSSLGEPAPYGLSPLSARGR